MKKSKQASGNGRSETQSLTRDEFLRVMQAERDDHTPPPGTPPGSVSMMFGTLEHADRWGTIRYGSVSRYNDGPEIRHVDTKVVARIKKRNERLGKRARLAARAQRMQAPRVRAARSTRAKKLAPIDGATSEYIAAHPGYTPAGVANHLRSKFMKSGESRKTYYKRVCSSIERVTGKSKPRR